MRKRILTNGIPVSAVILVVIAVCLGLFILPDCARQNVIIVNSTHSSLENVSVTGGVARGYAHWSGRLRPGEVRHIRITEHVATDLRLRGTDTVTGRAFEGISFYASTDAFPGATHLFLVERFGVHIGMWEADRAWIDPLNLGSLFLEEMACIDHVLWSRIRRLSERIANGLS